MTGFANLAMMERESKEVFWPLSWSPENTCHAAVRYRYMAESTHNQIGLF